MRKTVIGSKMPVIRQLKRMICTLKKQCPIHHAALKTDEVVIVYGLIRYPTEFLEAQKNHFACARMIQPGGCRLSEEIHAQVKYCEQCRVELVKWNQENGAQYGLPPAEIDDYIKLHRSMVERVSTKTE